MKKLIGIILGSLAFFAPFSFAEENTFNRNNYEAGIFVAGNFSGVTAATDGSAYLLARDHRLVKISPTGEQLEIKLPPIAGAQKDDYLCDLAAGEKTISFCGYPFSGIYVLDPAMPEKLEFIEITFDKKKINPMRIAVDKTGWRIRDAEERTLQVTADKTVQLLPEFSEIEPASDNQLVIIPPPRDEGEKIVYPGKALRIDGNLLWEAPRPESPREIMSLEYLGCDREKRDIFMVNAASGELDAEITLYAVASNKIVATRKIPGSDAPYVMRHCRLAPDGSILLIQADPNGREGILLKRLKLLSVTPSAG